MVDYKNLDEIIVKSQKELDDIPEDFEGIIYIEFGTYWNRAIVNKKYIGSVVARENSSVVARGHSSVEAWENSSVVARGHSSVVARENSSVEAWENSSVEARENSSVVARGHSSVEAWENSSVEARGHSSVVARENSSVEARENSSVEARENSSVEAGGNSQVVDRQDESQENVRIQISGNARKVYMPKNIEEFMNFYGIKHTKTKAIFYKAIRKDEEGIYRSDYRSNFTYKIGEKKQEECDTDIYDNCSYGIHIAHLNWALQFGDDWEDLAILEVETKISNIVMPENTNGKVRTSEIKVLREVPLKECGVYGKILAKRRESNDNN